MNFAAEIVFGFARKTDGDTLSTHDASVWS